MPVNLPARPSERENPGANAQYAHARVETSAPAAETARIAVATAAVNGVFTGSSLWHAQPPSLAQIWDRHVVSARYFQAALLRWPRYGWGAVHIVVTIPAYLLVWCTRSIPLLVLTVIVAGVIVWLI